MFRRARLSGRDVKKIYVIAGEASGDILGASFLQSLEVQYGGIEVRGIGGDNMLASGMMRESLFPMESLSLMGIVEVAPKIPELFGLIARTVKDVESFDPDILLSIDAPDFSFRVQKRVRENGAIRPHQVHYVAPTVWAWRPGRAKKIAAFLDQILCFLPFEPPYFEKVGLRADFVGHPLVDQVHNVRSLDRNQCRENLGVAEDAPVFGVLPGSRSGEIARMMPIYRDVIEQMSKKSDKLSVVIPTFEKYRDVIDEYLGGLDVDVKYVIGQDAKWEAFRAMDFALATSGTVGLELAALQVPHVIGYKMNRLTAFILRRLIRVKYGHLANIMKDQEIVPEFIQEDCDADQISQSLGAFLNDDFRQVSCDNLGWVFDEIGGSLDGSPADHAVKCVIDY